MTQRLDFPKSLRILRRSDYRRVYDQGSRFSSRLFTAFCLARADASSGPVVGFTTPRALGKAVTRNRLKRRLREAVRLRLREFDPKWAIVFNPRRALLEAPVSQVDSEVGRLLELCANS